MFMNIFKKKKKVLVAMSGGVDSSVAAALLKQQGYDVVGVFLKFWNPSKNVCRENACCNYESLQSARTVCDILDIPLHVFDVANIFKKDVVDYFISEYEHGRTPNPCVVCNKKIKFGWLLDKAHKLGCDYLSTGHYAKIEQKNDYLELFVAKDKNKDQTYFLWQLSQDQLKSIIFPLGNYEKSEVRQLAKKFKLPTYNKPESQDICFVHNGVKEFLKIYAQKLKQPGDIVDINGVIVGNHEGLIYYTVGQRENLPKIDGKKLSIEFDKHRMPAMYVLKLDVSKNQLVIGLKEDLLQKKLIASDVNWLGEYVYECMAKIRYNSKLAKCHIQKTNSVFEISFIDSQLAVTPGQSIVFYENNKLIGGGIIQ